MSAVFPFHDHLLEFLPAAVYVCDDKNRIVQHNRRAQEIWGMSPQAGEPETQFYSHFRVLDTNGMEVFNPPLAQVLMYGEPRRNWELGLEKRDGSRVYLLFNTGHVGEDYPGRTVALFHEIGDLKRAEEAVRASQRLAAASRLASSVAQQLTDPLQALARCTAELQEDVTLSETARRYAGLVQQQISRLGLIARQALSPYGARV